MQYNKPCSVYLKFNLIQAKPVLVQTSKFGAHCSYISNSQRWSDIFHMNAFQMNYSNIIQGLLIFSNNEMQAEIHHMESSTFIPIMTSVYEKFSYENKEATVAFGLPSKT